MIFATHGASFNGANEALFVFVKTKRIALMAWRQIDFRLADIPLRADRKPPLPTLAPNNLLTIDLEKESVPVRQFPSLEEGHIPLENGGESDHRFVPPDSRD